MDKFNTASLRSMAPHWSLAGDKQLLNILQDIHQKIMSHCQETNTKLEEMANVLDGANIDLQNVNNKFMALSNSQFIESRVYEDDIVVTNEDTRNKPLPAKEPESELSKLKQSIKTLESMHECVRILNSESDSDTDDDDGRMVFRPKDLYCHRPLPHIIGSQAWKRKWHAGLIPEDSDSDSSTSKAVEAAPDQYSQSESEESDVQTDRLNIPQRTISSSSSMAESEPSGPPAAVSQADIAAELARKLAGNLPEIPVRTPEPEIAKPQPVPVHVYKPQKPPTSTIFFDEPPPLDDAYQSDGDYNEDDDIFAELHQNKSTASTNKDQSHFNEGLFGGLNNSSSTVDDLFRTEQKETNKPNVEETTERVKDKKPVGGISVFGSLKNAESIGASILQRNPRKTYSSDESDEEMFKSKPKSLQTKHTENESPKTNTNLSQINKPENGAQTDVKNKPETNEKKTGKPERDILEDLFSKNKPSQIKNKDIKTKQELTTKDNKVDLFSDNLFDDIDDIFTDNIKVPIKEADKNVKSIFDDDDGDLFANVTVSSETNNAPKKTSYEAKDLFDSDNDELFSDIPTKTANIEPSNSKVDNVNTINAIKDKKMVKSIFDDDSDDDIFSNVQIKNVNIVNDIQSNKQTSIESKELKLSEDDDNNNLFSHSTLATNKKEVPSDNLTESNSTEESLQADYAIKNKISQNNLASSHVFLTPQSTQKTIEKSPALFDDDEYDKLFINSIKKEKGVLEEDSNHTSLENENKPTSEELDDTFVPDIINRREDFKEDNAYSYSKVATDPPNTENDSLSNKNDLESQEKDFESVKIDSDSDIFATKKENTPLPSSPTRLSPESDVFNDIFTDVPPEFEKPKEPKKSKNINALFDDDSDDEALFFKKDDVISDEKPEVSSAVNGDNLFTIFRDEPPAIDMDFPSEPTNEINVPELPNELEPKDALLSKQQARMDDKIQTNAYKENKYDGEANDDTDSTRKSIGKLKPINLNINVSTLLPGASPKKSKPIEEPDGLIVSVPDGDKQTDIDEPTLVKSVSFEGDADSELLNNKLSKERAKIQVKRRPSTRRARREAVKKSGIDFGSTDSTDNSSSIDSPKNTTKTVDITKKTVKSTEGDVKSKVVYILNDEDIFTNVKTDKVSNNATLTANEIQQKPLKNTTVLDNDDIFKQIQSSKIETGSSTSIAKSEQQSKIEKENINSSIKIENTQKATKNKASIFDDMSDEETELFCNKKPVVTNTKNIFGSDSDEELFGNSKKPIETAVEKKKNIKVDVKKSLFDDDSGDDLFGGGKSTGPGISIKSKEVKPTKTEAVLKDPLSLLSDDD